MTYRIIYLRIAAVSLVSAVAACGGSARLPVSAGMGPAPALPGPEKSMIPVVKVETAKGWPAGVTPVAGPGLAVRAFAMNLEHPRFLYVLPNGDVLVAESNGPPRPEDDPKGIRGWFMKRYFKRAGASVPSPNKIILLRDANGDGIAETRSVLLDSLYSPFGITLVGNTLYVANADALVAFPYHAGDMRITAPPRTIAALPGRPYNHHWTKSLIANADGSKFYVGVGSNSNLVEHGIEAEAERAAIWEIDAKTGTHRLYATGLRNPAGLAWEPETGALWASVNERDELGSDLVPDYMTAVHDGAFYGWPYSYFGQHVDDRVKPQRPDLVAKAIAPDYALGPHTASLGLTWSGDAALPAPFVHGMFVGQHGSWNRKPVSGYKVIFVPFAEGKPAGQAIDVLTGFIDGDDARGRPVGVTIDRRGALLVADDVGNAVWRVTARP
ncbi:MAG TPA: sorbosone dehydrogenase family protein [Gemmatimonadaceae bacterium]|nr:sorbosone dehydrogenase family protein [Gemmatimonadaceae bacterium]